MILKVICCFFKALEAVSSGCTRVCIMGDLNLPGFDWHSLSHPCNALYNAAADFVCYNGLIQLITDPTRFNNIFLMYSVLMLLVVSISICIPLSATVTIM